MKSLDEVGLPDDEIDMVTWENACRWYQFDPFEHRTRAECTVGALRAQATDVDTTPREYGGFSTDAAVAGARQGQRDQLPGEEQHGDRGGRPPSRYTSEGPTSPRPEPPVRGARPLPRQ